MTPWEQWVVSVHFSVFKSPPEWKEPRPLGEVVALRTEAWREGEPRLRHSARKRGCPHTTKWPLKDVTAPKGCLRALTELPVARTHTVWAAKQMFGFQPEIYNKCSWFYKLTNRDETKLQCRRIQHKWCRYSTHLHEAGHTFLKCQLWVGTSFYTRQSGAGRDGKSVTVQRRSRTNAAASARSAWTAVVALVTGLLDAQNQRHFPQNPESWYHHKNTREIIIVEQPKIYLTGSSQKWQVWESVTSQRSLDKYT